ncbi:MAG: DUF3024 domain-containing protein [Actinomycetota bacterium]
MRYTKSRKTWTLYWRDRNLRWHVYDRVPPASDVEPLLAEIDRPHVHLLGLIRSPHRRMRSRPFHTPNDRGNERSEAFASPLRG